jgi:hypothetical protein
VPFVLLQGKWYQGENDWQNNPTNFYRFIKIYTGKSSGFTGMLINSNLVPTSHLSSRLCLILEDKLPHTKC